MKKLKKKLTFIIEKTNDGFSVYSDDYPIFTTGINVSELIDNVLEASNFYFEDHGYTVSPENLNFELDFKQFFKHYRVINAKFLAEKIGMNPTLLSQYVQGHKKPSKSQTEKILSGIHQIGRELSGLNLIL